MFGTNGLLNSYSVIGQLQGLLKVSHNTMQLCKEGYVIGCYRTRTVIRNLNPNTPRRVKHNGTSQH